VAEGHLETQLLVRDLRQERAQREFLPLVTRQEEPLEQETPLVREMPLVQKMLPVRVAWLEQASEAQDRRASLGPMGQAAQVVQREQHRQARL